MARKGLLLLIVFLVSVYQPLLGQAAKKDTKKDEKKAEKEKDKEPAVTETAKIMQKAKSNDT